MAGQVDKMLKERLQAAGQWQAFLERRDGLKGKGYSPDDARTAALAAVTAECSDSSDLPAGEVLPIAPAALNGKSAPEPETVRWVARNIDNPKPDPAECPDPFAWTLLRQCRENPAFVPFFIEKLWVKLLPSRAQLEEQDAKVETDGQSQIDLIERIQAISRACRSA